VNALQLTRQTLDRCPRPMPRRCCKHLPVPERSREAVTDKRAKRPLAEQAEHCRIKKEQGCVLEVATLPTWPKSSCHHLVCVPRRHSKQYLYRRRRQNCPPLPAASLSREDEFLVLLLASGLMTSKAEAMISKPHYPTRTTRCTCITTGVDPILGLSMLFILLNMLVLVQF